MEQSTPLSPKMEFRSARKVLEEAPSSPSIHNVKDFWNKRPCNVRHSTSQLGSLQYFEEVATKKFFVEPHIEEFADYKRWKGKKVLEIGCGLGSIAARFAEAGADVTCVELSDVSLDLCKQQFNVKGLNGRFYLCSAEELDKFVPIEEYDLVWSFGVIHHTPSPENVMKAIRPFCGPHTELRIMVYAKVSYKLFFLMRESEMWDFSKTDQVLTAFAEAQTGCPVAYTYTTDGVLRLFRDYKVVSMAKDHIFKWKIDEYIKGNFVVDDDWKDVSPETFHEFEKELGWHYLVVAKLQ